MTLVIFVLVSLGSLLATLIFGAVNRKELRSLRRVVEEGHDELDVRVLSARQRALAGRTRYGVLTRARNRRAPRRTAYEEESLRCINDLIAKVEAHHARVAILLEHEQAAINRQPIEETPGLVAKAAEDLKQRLEIERGTHAKQEHAQGEKAAAGSGDEETKRERPPMPHATPAGQRTAYAHQQHAHSEQPAAPAGEESPEPARPTTLPSTPEDLEEHRKLVAATATGNVDMEDTATTHALSRAALATVALEAEAGGASLSTRGVPRALHAGSVAPPASAPPPLPSEPAQKAAGLGRPHSPHGARPPAPLRRTETIAGMPALQSQTPTESTLPERSSGATRKQGGTDRSIPTPAGSTSRGAVSAFAKTQASMPVQIAAPTPRPPAFPASFFEDETDDERESRRDTQTHLPPPARKPGDDDDEATEVIEIDPKALHGALRPTVQEGLRGMEGVPEAAPGRQRGHAEETPRKSRLTVLEAGK
jgi:hypothetical protein